MSWKDLHTNLWYYDYSLKSFGVTFQAKTLAVKLDNKSIVILSPGLPVEKIDPEFGSVDYIVSPNSFHHAYLPTWAATYPQAKIYAPELVQKKYPQLKFAGTPLQTDIPAWKNQLEANVVTLSPRYEEYSFYHKPSRTLILTDLCFNIQHESNWWSRTFWKISGVYGKFGPSRLVRTAIRDKKEFRKNFDTMLDRTIKQVVVAHGDIVQKNCKETLLKAFEHIA